MTVALAKSAIDLGIITGNGDAMLTFYRDTLGFRHEGDTPFPAGGTMHRLWCGDSLIKVVAADPAPKELVAKAPLTRANGYRYWTISVTNLTEIVERCAAAGHKVAVPVTEIRPGVSIAMVEDPDGNWVEFLQS